MNTIPAAHALHLAEVVARWGVSAEELFDGLVSRPESLADPREKIDTSVVCALVERARRLTGERGLGVYLGLSLQISAYGLVGLTAMAASSLRDALELTMRFTPTRTTALPLRLEIEDGTASLYLDEQADFGEARDVVVLALMLSIARIAVALTGRQLEGTLELAFDAPDYIQRFAPALPCPVRFGRPFHRLVFDASVLQLPLTMADPVALRLLREQCERELDSLGYGAGLIDRVRVLAAREDGAGFRSLEEVAARLRVSPRTLKRRLAAEGAVFSDIVETARRERATTLLRTTDLTIDAVAERVGYTDVANFARAFRRWTGTTPAAFRRGEGWRR